MALPSWITLSQNSGEGNDIVNVTVPSNSGEERSCDIYVTGNGLTQGFKVTQEATKNRKIYVYVYLKSFGWTDTYTCETIYNIEARSDYPIINGDIEIKVDIKDPNTGVITTKTLTILEQKSISNTESIFIQSQELFDSTVRFTTTNISRYVSISDTLNNTDLTITSQNVIYGKTGIVVINNKNISSNSLTFKSEYNDDTYVYQSLFQNYNFLVSWPYRGGLNLCSYKCERDEQNFNRTTYSGYIDYKFTLAKRQFNIGGGIYKSYYDIWNSIQSDGYKPVKKFTVKLNIDNLQVVSHEIVDIEYIEGKSIGTVYREEDNTLTSIIQPIYAGLYDGSSYNGIRLVSTGSGPDDYQIMWYHKLSSGSDVAKTVIRRLQDELAFSYSSFQDTSTFNVDIYSDEVYAEFAQEADSGSGEKEMERFYHPDTHPNNISY